MEELLEVKSMVENLGTQLDQLSLSTKSAAKIIDHQNRMLDVALDELISLATTEAIPMFFRKQITGVLGRIREIGIPS